MKSDPEAGARVAMGLVMLVLAVIGAALVKNASDDPMLVFGYALMIFGLAYVAGLVRQHFDALDHAGDAAGRTTATPRPPYAQAAE
jgi:uncharacterized membrane protein YfcA